MIPSDLFRSNISYLEAKIPKPYREICFWVLIALLIRLLFLPFACHADLLSTYYRSNLLMTGEISIFFGLNELSEYFQALTLFIFQAWIPRIIWSPDWGSPIGFGTASVVDWMEFVSFETVFQYITIFKMPYLIFDLLCVVLLYYIFHENEESRVIALSAWVACPVLIYAAYIFSRYETIAFFFILLSLFCVKIRKNRFAVFALGTAVLIRMYPLMLLPFYVVILEEDLHERIKLATIGVIPLIISYISKRITIQPIFVSSTVFDPVNSFSRHLLELRIGDISLFLISYLLILGISVYYIRHNRKETGEFEALVSFGLLLLISMYLFAPYMAIKTSWFSWILPFLIVWVALDRTEDGRKAYLLLIASWIILMLIRIDPSQFGGGLFAPANFALIDLPNFGNVISSITGYPASILKTLVVTLFSAALIWTMSIVTLRLFKKWSGPE